MEGEDEIIKNLVETGGGRRRESGKFSISPEK